MFTFTFLMLIIGLLGIIFLVQENRGAFDTTSANVVVYLNTKYKNINSEAVTLIDGKNQFMERVLPFDYNLDNNTLTLSYELPLKQAKFDRYYDLINSFEVFLEDKNYSRAYDGFETDVNTVQNTAWLGTDNQLRFLLPPLCAALHLNGLNQVKIAQTTSDQCYVPYDMNLFERFDVNVTLRANEDFNRMQCLFNGVASCPQDAFNPGDPDPFLQVNLLDAGCPNCQLTQTVVSGHFNPAQDHNITVYCDSNASCQSNPLTLTFGQHLTLDHSNTEKLDIILAISLSQPVNALEFMDFNLMVSRPEYNAFKR
jgi:hypothetical protein